MKKISIDDIEYGKVTSLSIETPDIMIEVPDDIYKKRLEVLRNKMQEKNIDCLVVYGDREHYSNFRYIAGYEPRFEEGVMVIHSSGRNYVLLGNECLGLYKESKIPVEPVLCQVLSMPNQTMEKFATMEDAYRQAGIQKGMKAGIVGWKLFTGGITDDYRFQFDIPSYLVEGLKNVVGSDQLVNATPLLIHPEEGIRIINDVHSIAAFEYGAAHASQNIKNMLEKLEPGKTELELAADLNPRGLVLSCHSILAAGENRFRGLISPTDRKVEKGDGFSTCMGMEGGLSSRCGYAAESEEDLKEDCKDYLEKLAKPYYAAACAWYEMITIGVAGGDIYQTVDEILPQKKFGWVLNPGHLIGTEEWMSSPIYPGSKITIKSGMIVQMDIIPDMAGYSSPGAEDGVCIADQKLQEEIKTLYPKVWDRMQKRRNYMIEELGIQLHPEVLPMSNLAGEYRPFLLNREKGLKVKQFK